MKIRHKILIAPAASMLCLALLGALSATALSEQDSRLAQLHDGAFTGFKNAAAQTIALGALHAQAYGKIAVMGSMEEPAAAALPAAMAAQIDAVAAQLGAMRQHDSTRAMAEQALPILSRYRKAVLDAIDLATMDANTGIAAMQTANSQYDAFRKVLDGAVQQLEAGTADSIAASKHANRRMLWLTLGTLGVAAAALLVISRLVSRSVTVPLRHAIMVAQTVAAGKLGSSLGRHPNDEIGQLLDALRDMDDSLARVVGDVRAGTLTIASATSQLAEGNGDLSQRTEANRDALHHTAELIGTLSGAVRQNAEQSRQAGALAAAAADAVQRGGGTMTQVIATMGEIRTASSRVVDIVSVIDAIAFQTNLLALNAAVEAAHAGEQGRGFAVVASEVRVLAQRSAEAAKEVRALIAESAGKVQDGARLADDAGAAMQDVVASIGRVNAFMDNICHTSTAQAEGILAVHDAIQRMDSDAQCNASMVEQASAATLAMRQQAEQLVRTVSLFELAGDAAQPAPVSALAAPAAPAPAARRERVLLAA
jgi:methyl-accepting chemotaxis protein I, serine sensor receptor